MSAYCIVEFDIVDKSTLLSALEELNLKPQLYEIPKKLTGYENREREQTAEIIVSKTQLNKQFTGASNDLGFSWNKDTKKYDILVSSYDVHLGVHERVEQAYAKVAIESAMKQTRFNVREESNKLSEKRRHKVRMVSTKLI